MDDARQAADPDDAEVVRHEEELRVDVAVAPYERVRLVKRVVSEVRTVEVEVRREELVVEREPVGAEASPEAGAGGAATLGQDDHELVLHEEQVEVVTRAVPVERVRVAVDVVAAGEAPVEASIARERVEVDGAEARS